HQYRRRFPSPPQPTVQEAVQNIVINTPEGSGAGVNEERSYILNVLVQNEPGVLNRVTGIMAARGYNIDTLVVSKTEVPALSRMTITIQANPFQMTQAKRQLEDLVPVWAVVDYSESKIVEREMLLCKLSIVGPELTLAARNSASATPSTGDGDGNSNGHSPAYSEHLLKSHDHIRAIKELTSLFQGRVVDVSAESVIVDLCAKSSRIDAFLKLIQPFGILEAARSGIMVMGRSVQLSMFQEEAEEKVVSSGPEVDVSTLPPG
ncbi:small subunit of acetolactate synthase-domain-containing protein, partial [Dimargaris cristalligena]